MMHSPDSDRALYRDRSRVARNAKGFSNITCASFAPATASKNRWHDAANYSESSSHYIVRLLLYELSNASLED